MMSINRALQQRGQVPHHEHQPPGPSAAGPSVSRRALQRQGQRAQCHEHHEHQPPGPSAAGPRAASMMSSNRALQQRGQVPHHEHQPPGPSAAGPSVSRRALQRQGQRAQCHEHHEHQPPGPSAAGPRAASMMSSNRALQPRGQVPHHEHQPPGPSAVGPSAAS